MVIRDGHFRCRNQIQLAIVKQFEKISFKLRQVAGTKQRVAIHNERRDRFEVAVFARMNVEHKTDQRPFKSRTRTVENRKTRGSEPRRTLEIENTESHAEIDVVLWLEAELRRRSPTTHLHVV